MRTRPRPTMVATRATIWARSGGRCEVVLYGHRCPQQAVDPAHVVKRSTGGTRSRAWLDDPVRVLAVCRNHHRWEDEPFAGGKLVHREREGQIESRVIWDKQEAREWRDR